MHYQKGTLAISYYVKARFDLVFFGIQQSSKKQYKTYHIYFQRKMACNLAPTCSFLFRYFLCTLPEDMIDIDITVYMLKGICTFMKD